VTTVRRAPQFHLGDRGLEAKRLAERQRYDLPARPEGPIPQVPDDLLDISDDQLLGLMTDFTRWAAHLSVQLALAEVDERWAEAEMERQRALALLGGTAKDVTRTKAAAYQSDVFLDAEQAYYERMAYRKLVAPLYANADRWAALLSRELTRRVNMESRSRRVDRYNT
jgi:hypothetical protein